MKIGAVTFWHGNDNYGMILQCWALQTYLRKLGHDPFVIRYNPIGCFPKRWLKALIKRIKCFVSKSFREEVRKENLLIAEKVFHYPERKFEEFREQYLTFSKLEYHYIEKLRMFPPNADCYICGSDQIWAGSLKSRNTWGYYLGFGKSNTKRIAYAPSFGYNLNTKDSIKLLGKALSRFDAISCREWNGVDLCKEHGYEATKVEDPTLLLTAEDYASIMSEKLYDNYIFIYSLNIEKPEDIYWEDIKSAYPNHKIVVTPSSGFIPGREIFGDEVEYRYATPGEWLSLIAHSDLVVTSSFHGIVFSILFNKKFAFVPLKGKREATNNRVLDLLSELDCLSATVISDSDHERLKSTEYRWDSINQGIKMKVADSKKFLDLTLK